MRNINSIHHSRTALIFLFGHDFFKKKKQVSLSPFKYITPFVRDFSQVDSSSLKLYYANIHDKFL